MNKKQNFTLFFILMTLLLGILPLSVSALPPIPHTNWGIVSSNGTAVTDGTIVTAEINGTEYVSKTTFTSGGQAGYYVFNIPGDDSDTPAIIEGGIAGDTIVFKVDGEVVAETAVWTTGNYTQLDLTVTEDAPTAVFTTSPASGTAPLLVTFTDASTGTITAWSWDFGDGNSSTAVSPAHTYTTPGTYTVTLTVTGPGGSDTATDHVAVTSSSGLSINPALTEVGMGETVTVEILITDIIGLVGIDLAITFDPALLEVVDADADPSAAGIQSTAGDCPTPDFTVENAADNSAGIVNYSTVTMSPNPACSGDGVVLSITFRGIAAGDSAITFDSWELSNANGVPITIGTPQNGSVTILPTGSIVGFVELQGRTDFSGVVMMATDGTTAISTTTDIDGNYELVVLGGTYVVTADMESYLDSEKIDVIVTSGSDTNLPDLWLPGGNAIEDDIINIQDLSLMGSHYGEACGDTNWDGRTDINNDCVVNIFDLTIAAGNFGQTSPVAWPR